MNTSFSLMSFKVTQKTNKKLHQLAYMRTTAFHDKNATSYPPKPAANVEIPLL
ncbi:hypothetical protein [Chitinophaga costaii]|uniref:hypothetical protein n=1 Tax=Chitinophaga costaii TaxID=1335309 RepID=UPI0013FD1EA9|nr:hypothetical protein [Chitinophaga costaii]